ncbi:MAG TPA: VTT domain-containing protein [Candidatus Acidoferrales bacterium]|nr:VTT domain-containing protein [Candidatus Acidoferrales bacterium]
MNRYHVPGWVLKVIAFSGGLSVFGLSFLDSILLPLPSLNDLLLIDLSIQYPFRMPYYAALATLGSLAGSIVLYFVARKGEEAAFHKKAGSQAPRIRHWIERNGFVSLLIAALLPPPTPFKLFVLAAGALGMPFRAFLAAMTIARAIRFFAEGYLAVRYGAGATRFLAAHSIGFAISTIAFIFVFYWVLRVAMRGARDQKV